MKYRVPHRFGLRGPAKVLSAGRPGAAIPSIDQSPALMLLPTVLSLTAGSCDTISFIGLGGLFTAHITGNLVVLMARVVAGENAPIAYPISPGIRCRTCFH